MPLQLEQEIVVAELTGDGYSNNNCIAIDKFHERADSIR
jgi:hypothetical protein